MDIHQQPTILAIDDDADILMVLKANLELHGFTLFTADSLAAAREVLTMRTPALVLLDWMLPDGDGLEFCAWLKEHYPHLAVIMLTAKDKVVDRVAGLEQGTDDYLVKPFATAELLARVRARLRPAPLPAPAVLNIGDLCLDLENQSLTVKGREVSLTSKQFQLLAILAASQGKLVSREEIRQKLWRNVKPYSWSRVIDVHIQHLRRKIEDNPAEPRYIVTVTGRGYRLQ
ncbi:MAG: response regulator transcription factor [Desulfurivibrio sp.]|nr:response regulator transcription factor [Desulfurivibrio sp.]